MKVIALCPLVSRDFHRAARAIQSAREQEPTKEYQFVAHPVINSRNIQFVRDITEWCERNNVRYSVTESNGTPSRGKNAALQMVRRSEYLGMSLMDGDDIFYPVAGQQIEAHLRHHPGTDLIVNKPMDRIVSQPDPKRAFLAPGQHGVIWGISEFRLPFQYGPGEHAIFEKGHAAATNLGHHSFYSRRTCEVLSYDEDQLLGEDFLFEFYALREHQQGNLAFWVSMASDFGLLDRTNDNQNIQTEHNADRGKECFDRLARIAPTVVPKWRSSFDELPVQFAKLIWNYETKVEWLKRFIRRTFD